MTKASFMKNKRKILFLFVVATVCVVLYQFLFIDAKHFSYAIGIRTPKMIVMIITAFCIGGATVVFQSIIQNTVVTPCLLGMNALYILIHTLVVFILGAGSKLVTLKVASFSVDLIIMAVVSLFIYGMLFRMARGNVMYILLIGTVMATLFGSITSTIQRVMDPNEFATLQNALIASFHKVNGEIIFFVLLLIPCILFLFRRELMILDVITLGKDQAINLGVDYDKTVRKLLIGVTLLIAIATALVGPISFLGLMIANLGRQIFKTYQHIWLIFGAAFVGVIALFAGQTLIEHMFNFSVNIGVFINVGGGIYFLYLLLQERR